MRTEVVGRNVEVTDAIRGFAETKADKLHKYYDGVQLITWTLSRVDHAQRGLFEVELVIDVEKHDDFIAHAQGEDLYATIDLALGKGVRQLTDFKEKLKMGKR